MGLGIGGIVSVGGSGGGSSGGSGIQELNGQVGPVVNILGASGIVVEITNTNEITIGVSGLINTSQSGVVGVNGIAVYQVGGNFVIDGVALSGQSTGGNNGTTNCFEASFTSITSGLFQHNLGTRSLVVEIMDNSSPPRAIMPDAIIFDTLDALSVLFNTPQTGNVTVLTCGNGSSSSGIQRINNQTGPSVTLVGTSGITISPVAPNQINIGFDGSVTQSGVVGVNGISVQQIGGNFVIDGAALSGVAGGGSTNCFESSFSSITSGLFQHNFGTRSLVVQITDDSNPPRAIMPDAIVFDTLDAISVLFNTPQTGSVTILTCGNGSGVGKFSQALTDVVSANIMHGLASEDVIVQVRDTSQDVTIPDRIRVLDSNTVSLQFNTSFTGRVVIVG